MIPEQVSFVPVAWDDFLPRRRPCQWSAEGRVLLFWFSNQPQSLRLSLQISAGTDPTDRDRLITLAETEGLPCRVASNARRAAWSVLYSW